MLRIATGSKNQADGPATENPVRQAWLKVDGIV